MNQPADTAEVTGPAGTEPNRRSTADPFRLAPDLSNAADSPHLSGDQRARIRALNTRLTDLGVKTDQPVGICLRRGPGMVEAILAVWSAGAQYVPVDPSYPPERQLAILEDSGTGLVIVDETTGPAVKALPIPVSAIDTMSDGTLDTGAHPTSGAGWRVAPVPANAAAYTIFTSGSTGRPKGVCVPREAIAAFLNAMADLLPLGPQDTSVAVTTLCFDISLPELLLPVLTGCRSVVADEETCTDGEALLSLLADVEATVLQAVPTMWRMLLLAGPLPNRLRVRLSAGEALAPDLAEQLLARSAAADDTDAAEVSVWNQYGPTETCVYSAVTRVRPGRDGSLPAIVLGPTLAGESWSIRDDQLRPVRRGQIGQLWIGGIGVARGYVGNPRKNALAYRPDPAGHGRRMYATGDLARSLGAGMIEIIGRIDHQLKVRGFRIEPGEIEVALRRVPEISDAVVVAQPGPSGPSSEKELVAYVAAPRDLATDAVREHLAASLPAHLIPSLIQALPALPRNANGKIDRAALPDARWDGGPATDPSPDAAADGEPVPAGEQVPSTDPTVAALISIWTELLGVAQVSEEDNFFVLGGHSLTAARLVSRVREDLGVGVRQRELFSHPTLGAQAALVKERLAR